MKLDDSHLPENRCYRRRRRARLGVIIIVILSAALLAIHCVS